MWEQVKEKCWWLILPAVALGIFYLVLNATMPKPKSLQEIGVERMAEASSSVRPQYIPTAVSTPDSPALAEVARVSDSQVPACKDRRHEVLPGSSLWKIAQEEYGDASLWLQVAQANGLTEPYTIHYGTKDAPKYLTIPCNLEKVKKVDPTTMVSSAKKVKLSGAMYASLSSKSMMVKSRPQSVVALQESAYPQMRSPEILPAPEVFGGIPPAAVFIDPNVFDVSEINSEKYLFRREQPQ